MSLDQETIKRLELRDDSQRGLFSLLKEENLTARDLIRLKKQYEQSGQWDYKPDRVTQRLLKIEANRVLREREELLASRRKGEKIKAALSQEKPLPRSKEICSWKGLDPTGNVYWCNNHVLRHPKTNDPFTECGYHIQFCIGDHKAGQTRIDVPNKNALCQPHRVAASAERNQRALIEGTAAEVVVDDDDVDGDGSFADSLNIPGVVFARAGTLRHPLAPGVPKKTDVAAILEEEDEDDEEEARRKAEEAASKKLAMKKKTKSKWRERLDKIMLAIELPHETRRRRNAAAAVIQARVRSLIAIRVVNRMKREVQVNERIKAAILVQRAYRRLKGIKLTRAKFINMTNAASTLQRWYRYVVWSRKRLRDQELRTAAAKLIRWFRLRRTKFLLKSLVIRAQARSTNKRRVDGIKASKSLVRQWKFRRCVYAAMRQNRRQTRAVKRIQVCWKLYRARMDKNNKVAQKKSAMEMMRQTIRIQRVIRDYCKRRIGKIYRQKLLNAAALLNRIGRGMLGRLKAARQRANIEAVWKWLAPTLPREMYAEYLGFADYDRQFDLSKFRMKRYSRGGVSTAGSDMASSLNDMESKNSEEVKTSEGKTMETEEVDPFDDDSPQGAERREKLRAEMAKKGGQLANVFGTILGKSDSAKAGALTETEQLQAMIIEKEKRMKQKAQQANYELMKRSSQPVPMGRDTSGKTPRLIPTLAEVTKGGRQPLAPPPKATMPVSSKLSADIIAYLDRLEKEFLKYDARGLGFVTSKGFQRILEASGTILTERLWKVLFETFVASGSDKISYKAYLQYARRLDRPCPSHRVLVCPACIYPGPCDKCLCKKYDSEGDIAAVSNPHSEMCLCGHHKSRHAPAVRVHPEPPAITGQGQTNGRPPEPQAKAAEAMPAKAGYSTNKPGLFGSIPHDIAALGMAQKAFSILPSGIIPRGMSTGDGQLEIDEMNLTENLEFGGLITRKVHGIHPEDTVAVRALRGNNIIMNADGGLIKSRADELARITDGIDEEEQGVIGRKASRNNAYRISDSLPAHAVAHLTLPDLLSANNTLESLARLSEREMKEGIARTLHGNSLAIERMNRLTISEGEGGPKSRLMSRLSAANVSMPLYDRAMQELDNMTYYGTPASTVSRVSTSDVLYNGPFHEVGTPTYFANTETRGEIEFPGPNDDQIWDAPQPRPDSRQSLSSGTGLRKFELQDLRPASGAVLADANEWAEEALTYNSGTGGVVVAVPRMTPLKGRRGRTPPFRKNKIPDHSPRTLPTQKVLVPSMFVHAVAAGADVAAGAQEPTSQATAEVLEANERRQIVLETDHDVSGSAGSLVRSASNGGTSSPSSRAMFTYLMILRSLALPSPTGSGYDVVADADSLLQLIVSHFGFLQVYWRDLIRDIRIGKLQGGPEGVLSEEQRLALGQILAPNPGRASYLENVMRGQGLHKYQPNPQNSGQAITDLYFSKSITEKDLRELKDPGKAMPDRIRRKREEIARASAAAAASASPLRTSNPTRSRSNSSKISEKSDSVETDLAAPQSSRRAVAAMSFLETSNHKAASSTICNNKLAGAGIGGLQPIKQTRSLGDAPPRGGLVAIPLPPPDVEELRRVNAGYAPPLSVEGGRREGEGGISGYNNPYTMLRPLPQLPFDRDFAPSSITTQEELRQKERYAMGLTKGADEALRNARAEYEAQEQKKLATALPTRPGMPHDPHYFKLEGEARPFMCRSPGCGATFGTLAAAVRHTKKEHTGVLPLFVSTETDAFLKDVWASAGLVASGWVPSQHSEVEEKAKALLENKIAKKKAAKNEIYSPKRHQATSIQLSQ